MTTTHLSHYLLINKYCISLYFHYPCISLPQVVKLIFQGILLSPPDTCPPQVCDLMRRCWATDPTDRLKFPEILAHLKGLRGEGKGVSPHDTSPHPPVSPCGPPVTYSQLCLQEEAAGHLDQDLYLVPRRAEPREYLTILN